jgi:SAM-dependent methyltransferase
MVDATGKTRDAEFGARVVETALGGVTRMWLDGNVEIDFLRRNLPGLERLRVLDIGAGYGRLAVMLRPFVKEYTCVDPVAISTALCRAYTARFAPEVITLGIEEFVNNNTTYDLAINIHCWNECTLAQVDTWIRAIAERKIPYLFTVDHGRADGAYRAWNNTGSFRPVIEKHYRLVKEETLAIERNSHALWILNSIIPGLKARGL